MHVASSVKGATNRPYLKSILENGVCRQSIGDLWGKVFAIWLKEKKTELAPGLFSDECPG
jgi:hypothetical protein